jgi:hypothetical protein
MELGRHLGVSYPTSWKIKHKLLQAMQERDSKDLLRGVVQLDDANLSVNLMVARQVAGQRTRCRSWQRWK